MTTRRFILKSRGYIKSERITEERIHELLEGFVCGEKDSTNTEIKEYNPLEDKTKKWIREYKKYLKSSKNYSFYEPYIGLREHKGMLIQDKWAALFEFGKHPKFKEIKKLIELPND